MPTIRLEDKFKVGDIVGLTPLGIARDSFSLLRKYNKCAVGRVTGFSLCGQFVSVRRTGDDTSGNYYRDSWDVMLGVDEREYEENDSAIRESRRAASWGKH